MRRALPVLLLALCAVRGPTSASAQPAAPSTGDPAATVRAYYDAPDGTDAPFYARRLRALYLRDRREAAGEVGRLDFDVRINGQDTEDGWRRTLAIETRAAGGDTAEVRATFRNGTPQDIRYDLVREGGRWLIADVRSLQPRAWRLTTILSQPLR